MSVRVALRLAGVAWLFVVSTFLIGCSEEKPAAPAAPSAPAPGKPAGPPTAFSPPTKAK